MILSLLIIFRFAGETNEDGESNDEWEEETETEPEVQCFGLNYLASPLSFSYTSLHMVDDSHSCI